MIYLRDRHKHTKNSQGSNQLSRNTILEELKSRLNKAANACDKEHHQVRSKGSSKTMSKKKTVEEYEANSIPEASSGSPHSIAPFEISEQSTPKCYRSRKLTSQRVYDFEVKGQMSPVRKSYQQCVQALHQARTNSKQKQHESLNQAPSPSDEAYKMLHQAEELLIESAASALRLVRTHSCPTHPEAEEEVQNISGIASKIQHLLESDQWLSLQEQLPHSDSETAVWQLSSLVQCQQKTIRVLQQNSNGSLTKRLHHENTLLRHQVNRLSRQQEAHRCHSITNTSSINAQTQTGPEVPPEVHNCQRNLLITIEPSESSQSEGQAGLIKHQQSLIANLTIQKQYIADKNRQLEEQIAALKAGGNMVTREEYEISQEEVQVQAEQITLLKNKIQQLKDRHVQFKQPQVDDFKKTPDPHQTSISEEGEGRVSVEEVLRCMRERGMSKQHTALVELIGHYESKISALTSEYCAEKQIKDKLTAYCQRLYNASHRPNLPQVSQLIALIDECAPLMQRIVPDPIEAYLRRVKALSVGVHPQEKQLIASELHDYVGQLQSRLPALSEEYFEDGSSVASTLRTSVEQFE